MSLPPVAPLAEMAEQTLLSLRERCSEAAYSEDAVAEMDGLAPGMFGRESRPLIHHALVQRGDACADLARLFAFEDALTSAHVRLLLGDDLLLALLAAGLLVEDEAGEVRSPFQLRPFEGLWLLADDASGGPNAVMPPAGTTRLVTQIMPASITGSVLDVGCGPGSLALAAASRGAAHVVGTDVNSRAVELARFNARLNGLAATEFLVGDLVEPVAGRQFDLVVSQPPFIIQPPDSEPVAFLHGGPSGEELTLRLLAAVPSVMAGGGRALVLFEALARSDEPLHSRARAVIGDAPVDLLVLAAPGAPPAIQVIAYATLEAPGGGEAYQAAARRYLKHLDTLGANDFQLGMVVLRKRPAGDAGRRKLAATVPVSSLGRGNGSALERLLGALDLAALDDAALERQAVCASSHARWTAERPRPDESLEPVRMVHFRSGSFGSDLELSPRRYGMSAILDQAPTIAEAANVYAEATEQSVDDARREVLGFVREGLMRGLLEARPD